MFLSDRSQFEKATRMVPILSHSGNGKTRGTIKGQGLPRALGGRTNR